MSTDKSIEPEAKNDNVDRIRFLDCPNWESVKWIQLEKLPDGSGGFVSTIMSEEEAMSLPLDKKPLNYRISSDIYHAIFEAVGASSMCWEKIPTSTFDNHKAEKIAVDLCFKIAEEIESKTTDTTNNSKHLMFRWHDTSRDTWTEWEEISGKKLFNYGESPEEWRIYAKKWIEIGGTYEYKIINRFDEIEWSINYRDL